MTSRNLVRTWMWFAVLVALVGAGSQQALAQTESLLHSFSLSSSDGQHPYAGLTMDSSGNLYGTTYVGGTHGRGIAYKLSSSGGTWTESVLWNFGNTGDGYYPSSGMFLDGNGTLWGTTNGGGLVFGAACPPGCGTFFSLANVAGVWVELPLFNFGAAGAGYWPVAIGSLIQDSSGNFYGTTTRGGAYAVGAAFKMTVGDSGTTEEVIYSFHPFAGHPDGVTPQSALTMDSSGNLYGTTVKGGAPASCNSSGCGMVYRLSPNGSGYPWTETVLYNFAGPAFLDGAAPAGRVVVDSAGNVYGTTQTGGAYNLGTVFELSQVNGVWIETILHNFGATGDGSTPVAGLLLDSSGNLYGTTEYGGGTRGGGTVFKLSPTGLGLWSYAIMHTFIGGPTDGANPISELIMDSNGVLYGTTYDGGAFAPYGAVFKIVP